MGRQPSESQYLHTFWLDKNAELEWLFEAFFHIKSTRFNRFHNKNFILTQPEKVCLKKYFGSKT